MGSVICTACLAAIEQLPFVNIIIVACTGTSQNTICCKYENRKPQMQREWQQIIGRI